MSHGSLPQYPLHVPWTSLTKHKFKENIEEFQEWLQSTKLPAQGPVH